MSLTFDPKTGHFRNSAGHLVYNPGGPPLPEGTPMLMSMSQFAGSSRGVENAFTNLRINDEKVEEKKKTIQKNPENTSFSEKEWYVTSRDPSCDRFIATMIFFKERGQQKINSMSSRGYNPSVDIRKEIEEDQKACSEHYKNLIERRYQELKESEAQPKNNEGEKESSFAPDKKSYLDTDSSYSDTEDSLTDVDEEECAYESSMHALSNCLEEETRGKSKPHFSDLMADVFQRYKEIYAKEIDGLSNMDQTAALQKILPLILEEVVQQWLETFSSKDFEQLVNEGLNSKNVELNFFYTIMTPVLTDVLRTLGEQQSHIESMGPIQDALDNEEIEKAFQLAEAFDTGERRTFIFFNLAGTFITLNRMEEAKRALDQVPNDFEQKDELLKTYAAKRALLRRDEGLPRLASRAPSPTVSQARQPSREKEETPPAKKKEDRCLVS